MAAAKSEVRRMLVSYEASSGARTSGVGRDAALGGLFIETKVPLPIGTLLSVELSSPTTTVTLDGRVFSSRTASEGVDKPAGMGVRFLDLPQGMLAKLQSILDHHRPPSRTRIGVGDEKEALWTSAGGREESRIEDVEDIGLVPMPDVEGMEAASPPPAPREEPAPPPAPPPPSQPPPSSMTAQPVSAPPPSSLGSFASHAFIKSPPPAKSSPLVILLAVGVVLVVVVGLVVAVIAR
jgi:hypothetical protein